jgi:hypothetical protein
LKRALESVYTRFSSREETREKMKDAEMDAELIAKCAIERLTQKDDQIVALNIEISELKARLLQHCLIWRLSRSRAKQPMAAVTRMLLIHVSTLKFLLLYLSVVADNAVQIVTYEINNYKIFCNLFWTSHQRLLCDSTGDVLYCSFNWS